MLALLRLLKFRKMLDAAKRLSGSQGQLCFHDLENLGKGANDKRILSKMSFNILKDVKWSLCKMEGVR